MTAEKERKNNTEMPEVEKEMQLNDEDLNEVSGGKMSPYQKKKVWKELKDRLFG